MPILIRITLFFIIILIFKVKIVEAQQSDQSLKIIKRVGISGAFNDNLIIGTETRSPLLPIADQILMYEINLGIEMPVAAKHRFTGLYHFNNENQQKTNILRRIDHRFSLSMKGQFGDTFGYILNGDYHLFNFKELTELNFNEASLSSSIHYAFQFGLMAEFGYKWLDRSFLENISNVTGYSLVSSQKNIFYLRLKKWLSEYARLSLKLAVGNLLFDKTASTYLNNISDLSPENARNDNIFSVQPEITFLIWQKQLLLNLGFEIEGNNSNSDYYNYFGIKALGDIVIKIHPDHSLIVESSFGVYDYSDRQFNTRYKNTKEDFRTTLFITYEWILSESITLEINYHYMKNDSNDSFDYDPITSWTYSSFTQNLFKTTVNFDFTNLF